MMADVNETTHLSESAEQTLAWLFNRYHNRLFALAIRMQRDREEAKDLVQDTFLRASKHLGKLPADSSAQEAWLVRILVNLIRDRGRRGAVRERVHDTIRQEESNHDQIGLDEAFVARQSVMFGLSQLAPKRRAVVILTTLEELSTAEVARILNMRPVTVRWHLSRARAILAEVLRDSAKKGKRHE